MINHRVVVTALAPALWGTTFYVTTEYLPPDRPLLASLLRALPTGLTPSARARELPRGEWWWRSLVLDAPGVAAALGGAAVTAAAIVLNKRWVSSASALATTGWQLVAAGIVLVPLAFALEDLPSFTARNVAGYAFLSVFGGAVAYVVWIRGITLLTATQVTFLGLLTPVVAAMIGWAALGQRLTAVQLLGAAIVLTAMTVAQTRTQSDVREIRV